MRSSDRVIVVGAGLGGLAAAIRLAAAGHPVTVLEKNERVGGKLNLVAAQGYTFDTGPSLLTMPWVIEELFAAAGRSMGDYLQLDQVEPTCRYNWPDGTVFNAWQRLPQLVQEVERLSPADVPGLFRFLAHTARIYDAVADSFLLKPFDGLAELITPRLLRDGPRIDAMRSVDAAVRSFFRSPHLRQLFNRYATYNGSSPYSSPATFNVIAYIELAEGGWYVRGGMYRLAAALERLCAELGVELRLNSPVAQVLHAGGAARGVRLASGEELPAAQVVVNADPRYAYGALIPGQAAAARRLARLEPSCSGFVLFLGVDRVYEGLAHHNIFFGGDYRAEFAAIFEKGVPAADPTVYVAATSLSDPAHAPPGHMNLFALVNAPALGPRVCWEREAAAYGDMVIARLERMGLPDLGRHIVYRHAWTPADLETRYNAAGGAIYGLASNNPFSAFMRPPLRARELRGLYFVGGGTHPGGGIPLVLLSGRAVAERVVADCP
ncbi:MAG TPA: phytoene desaturase family protein [Chloroflexaceae bacterium]|nr:phytoene desaturase family protein [Chloroflexaceae bacterium]